MLVALVAATLVITSALSSGYFLYQHSTNLQRGIDTSTSHLRESVEQSGRVLVRSVAMSIERAVLVMDFLFVAQVIRQTVQENDAIEYGIVIDAKGAPLAHTLTDSDHELFGKALMAKLVKSDSIAFEERRYKDRTVLEVTAPIQTPNGRWGTLRFGLSLVKLNKSISQTKKAGEQQIREGLITSTGLVFILLILGTIASMVAARKITQPVANLLNSVNQVRAGNLEIEASIAGAQELRELSGAFNDMTGAIRERDHELRERGGSGNSDSALSGFSAR